MNIAFMKEDVMMHFDLSPIYKSTIGFDRIFSLLDEANLEAAPTYPPYDIERTGEDEYRITMAVAGFSEDDINVELKEGTLTVTGDKQERESERGEVLHQGIAARAFERRFQLADFVQVTGAVLENGLLHIDLKRELPEAMKPRRIAVTTATGKNGKKKLTNKAA